MKSMCSVLLLCFLTTFASAQNQKDISVPDSTEKIMSVQAACGECKFDLKGKGCNLAVRIDGKAYFVDGIDIDAFGDPHAQDGFCEAISNAEVQGKIVKNRFKATYFKVIK